MPNVEIEFPYYYELLDIPKVQESKLKEILKSIRNAKSIYPVLYFYLETDKKRIEYLQSFPYINNFVNYTIEHYTNNISRNNAKIKKIKDEITSKNIPRGLFDEFLKAFNETGLYKIADQYKCHYLREKNLELRKFNENDSLSNFLIDNGQFDYGMQIAAIYQKFTSFQNDFLQNVIDNIPDGNRKLNYLKSKISEKMAPQKANNFNIISFDIQQENFGSFLEMILFYSYIDSFQKNDFFKEDRIKYNFEEIEEQLENLLLPGKKILTDKLDFVIYQFEGFRSQNSSILSGFILNYPQKNLDEEQQNFLNNFRSEQYSSESLMKILFSIQLMITHYNDIPVYTDKNLKISETINDFPIYFRIPEETKNLFKNNSFTLSHILSVYEYFELLCFNEFKNNIDPSYKKEIDDKKIIEINNYFEKNPNVLLNKLKLSSALRKFISRSLVGIRVDFDVDREQELFYILQLKEDCWSVGTFDDENFNKEIEELKKLNIKVGQILSLYETLGGDSELLGKDIQNKINKKEDENNRISNKNKIKKKKNKKTVF